MGIVHYKCWKEDSAHVNAWAIRRQQDSSLGFGNHCSTSPCHFPGLGDLGLFQSFSPRDVMNALHLSWLVLVLSTRQTGGTLPHPTRVHWRKAQCKGIPKGKKESMQRTSNFEFCNRSLHAFLPLSAVHMNLVQQPWFLPPCCEICFALESLATAGPFFAIPWFLYIMGRFATLTHGWCILVRYGGANHPCTVPS